MLFVPPIFDLDEELSCDDGFWPREQLERMNDRFVAAVERAFELKLESRVAAAATVRIGRNGTAVVTERAIKAAWDLLCGRKGEMAAAEVLKFIRNRCPNIDPAYVKASLAERLRQREATW
jgi:hypothetical protein